MKQRVEEKQEEYGDSWEVSAIGFLRERVEQNFGEWSRAYIYGYLFDEGRAVGNDAAIEKRKLVDLANTCMLLWKRLG